MGRGLSELQRTILVMARDNRIAESLVPITFEVIFRDLEGGYEQQWSEEGIEWMETLARIGYSDVSDSAEAEFKQSPLPPGPFLGDVFRERESGWCVAFRNTPGLDEAINTAKIGRSEGIKTHVRMCLDSFNAPDIYAWEILDRVYGFGMNAKSPRYGTSALAEGRKARHWITKRFSRTEIGAKRYDSARIATSKGFRRLKERGFAIDFRLMNVLGMKLTDEGMKLAEDISATCPNNIKTGSR